MERKVPFSEGEYYHLYNRGVERRTIFSTAIDYKRFLMLLYLANSERDIRMSNVLKSATYDEVLARDRGDPLVAVGAYCLMPNHFHVLATPLTRDGISRYMLKVQTGYSMYFNTKNERNGSLFQGPFKSVHADSDEYLKYLYSYIHLNPAKLKDPHWREHVHQKKWGLQRYVESYPYSSYAAYLLDCHAITDPSKFPEYFSSKKELASHITDWLVTTA